MIISVDSSLSVIGAVTDAKGNIIITRFLCAMRVFEVRASSSPPINAAVVLNFVSVVTSVAGLAHGEKSRTYSITHPEYLMRREPKLSLRNNTSTRTIHTLFVQRLLFGWPNSSFGVA